MSLSNLQELMRFAAEACQTAASIALKYYHSKQFEVEFKEDHSHVTIADRKTEEYLRRMIANRFPEDNVVGEEFGNSILGSDFTWYIDPIDGTSAFVRGVPIFGTMLGLELNREFVVGAICLPALNELIYAAKGEGCYWNGDRAHVSQTENISEALLCISGVEYFAAEGRQEAYKQLEAATAIQRTWGDCYGHVLVATGRADLCVDPMVHPWDVAALIPILQEAGGTCTDWQGKVTAFNNEVISTNNLLLRQVISLTSRFTRA